MISIFIEKYIFYIKILEIILEKGVVYDVFENY